MRAFSLIGKCNEDGPSAIPLEAIQQWEKEKLINYLGEEEDIRPTIALSYCIVLPSYKEGVPRALLEAMSMQKPIITTLVNGCKECVAPPLISFKNLLIGKNGILIPPKDPVALSDAMDFIANLSEQEYKKMAEESRKYVIERFCMEKVLEFYKASIQRYTSQNRLVFVSNSCFGMYNFRLEILRNLKNQGYEIHIIAPNDNHFSLLLQNEGFILHFMQIHSTGLNPLRDLKTLFSLRRLFCAIQPHLIFNYTIKPVIYGAIAARDIPNIAITTGLGYVFIQGGWKKRILKKLVVMMYKIALKKSREVWFLNQDDKNEFLNYSIVPESKVKILDSEGVDVNFFTPRNYTSSTKHFLLIARMLWNKGIGEFIESIKLLKSKK